jgi:fido (protein-threonine AMPylation protein)
MPKLTKRQAAALEFIRKRGFAGNQEIKEHLRGVFGELSRITIIRDLDVLLQNGLIKKQGKGRTVNYSEAVSNKLLSFFDPETYFAKGPDERILAFQYFNFEVFKNIPFIFSEDDLKEMFELNTEYEKRVKKLTPATLKKEYERLTIELSWKSSQIEGNTYSLIDTEILIKDKKEATGHKKEEAIMILNHKKALDYIFSKTEEFKRLDLRDIENIHALLTGDLNVTSGLRKHMIGITGSAFKPLDNEHQIREAVEKMIATINNLKEPFSKALATILLLSYIQPFEDGNKRTARILSDAILLAHDICPLSWRSVSETDYKKAILLFYEQNSARLFKEIFISQFEFSIQNYFL